MSNQLQLPSANEGVNVRINGTNLSDYLGQQASSHESRYSFNLMSFAPDQPEFCADLKAPARVREEQHARLQWLPADASSHWGKMRSVCIAEDSGNMRAVQYHRVVWSWLLPLSYSRMEQMDLTRLDLPLLRRRIFYQIGPGCLESFL
jgi:hypothetical protein